MMLTPDGRSVVATLLSQRLTGGLIEVGDGNGSSAQAPMSVEVDGEAVRCMAVFAADVANFEWRVRRVLDGASVLVDEEAEDFGRKAGGEWVLEAVIEITAGQEN